MSLSINNKLKLKQNELCMYQQNVSEEIRIVHIYR